MKKSLSLKTVALGSLALFLQACTGGKDYEIDDKNTVTGVCRSCQPYQIDGVWYYPQRHYDYDVTGTASWYGPGFHGRPKAMGEKYDQHDISAAHKTLPLPTVVSVTNLKNGKSLKLVVDDRGPYIGDRIIDLSKGAAKALGTHENGLAEVRVMSLAEESQAFSKYLLKVAGKHGRGTDKTWNVLYKDFLDKREQKGDWEEDSQPPVYYTLKTPSKQPADTVQSVSEQQSFNRILDDLEASSSEPSRPPKPSAKSKPPLFQNVAFRKEVTPPQRASIAPGTRYLKVGAYVQRKNAEKLVESLKKQKTLVSLLKVEREKRGPGFFVITVGPFKSEEQLKNARILLGKKGLKPS